MLLKLFRLTSSQTVTPLVRHATPSCSCQQQYQTTASSSETQKEFYNTVNIFCIRISVNFSKKPSGSQVAAMDNNKESSQFDFSSSWHFSDIVLLVEGTKFHVHKSTLSMWSPVFERMFTSEFAERNAEEIQLPGKHSKEVEVLLRVIYSYGKEQSVNDENCQFLLELAEEYQMDKVRSFCSDFLMYNIQESNSIHYYKTADHFHLTDVMNSCIQEARFMTSLTLEEDHEFNELKPEIKLEICFERVKELEKTLSEYAKTCSTLVEVIYKDVASTALAEIECDNLPVHQTGSHDAFKMSCKCCRRRVQNANCELQYFNFRHLLKKLFDLEHCNRMARRAKNCID